MTLTNEKSLVSLTALFCMSLAVSEIGCGKSNVMGKPAGTTAAIVTKAALGSCDFIDPTTGFHTCVDMVSSVVANPSTQCKSDGETYSVNPCSTAGVIGSCRITSSQGVGIARYYDPTSVTDAQDYCVQSAPYNSQTVWLGPN